MKTYNLNGEKIQGIYLQDYELQEDVLVTKEDNGVTIHYADQVFASAIRSSKSRKPLNSSETLKLLKKLEE